MRGFHAPETRKRITGTEYSRAVRQRRICGVYRFARRFLVAALGRLAVLLAFGADGFRTDVFTKRSNRSQASGCNSILFNSDFARLGFAATGGPMKHKRKLIARRTYWEALGRFTNEFAKTERALYLLLVSRLRLRIGVANAIFPGLRADGMIKNLRRLAMEQTGHSDLGPYAEKAAVHLKPIADFRNEILHTGTKEGDDFERIIVDEVRSRSEPRTLNVSGELLSDLTHDLGKIRTLFLAACLKDDVSMRERLRGIGRQAWRYKPPPKPQQDRECSRKRRRQQRQSPGPRPARPPQP